MRARSLKLNRSALAVAAATLLGGLAASPAQAVTCTWIPAAGNWNVPASWNCGFVPGNLDTALIASGQTVTVTGAQPPTNVNNSGTVDISNNSSLGLLGSNTNTGNINLGSIGNQTDLSIHGVTSLLGNGSVNLSNSFANRIVASGVSQLTLGAGQTVQGSGQIGAGGTLELINNGLIQATSSSGMVISTSSGVTNNAALRANGGTLTLQSTSFAQGAAGVIEGLGSSAVVLNNSSITGGSLAGTVNTFGGSFANSLANVTNTGTLRLVNNSGITLNGTLTNNGTVQMQSAGNSTDLVINGAQSVLGNGSIQLTNTLANRIYGTNATLTLGSGQTLTGAGTIGTAAAGFALANQGTIIASSSAGLLINASAGVTNTGTLRADGGNLSLQTTVNSGGGAIEARNGSQVLLLNGAVINNANFSSIGAGSLITTVNGATVTLGGGTVAGPMTLANNSFLRLTGDLTYNGTLTMNSVGNNTDLILDGARTIGGAATIQMSNATANRIYAANPGDSLTLGSGVTLQGSGQLGTNTALAITNNGTVIATQSSPLLIETSAGLTNNGVLRADGGTLQFGNVVVNSSGGSIEARNGSQVQLLNGSTINNANFSATGAGSVITTVNGATVTLGGGTVAGPMTVANNSFLRLTGDLTYNGTLSMNSVGNNTDLIAVGARTISGAANISLSNAAANRIYAATGADSLTFASGVTVEGAGSIGAGTATAVTNNGSWIANQSAGMVLSTTGAATNNNLIRADGATFSINQTSLSQGASGVLNAINNGRVVLNNGTVVTGGTFSTATGGQVVVTNGNLAAISGVTNTGTLSIQNNAFLNLRGTLTNDGVFNMESIGNFTELRADGNRIINGTGTINLSNISTNRIYGVTAGDSLTLGSGQTLQGAGSIGAATQFNFTNNGTMLGNVSTALTFSSTGTVTNNNVVRADAGNVVITGATNFGQGAGGTLSAINGGVVQLIGNAVVSGGTLATTGTGQITTANGETATIANLANTGTFNMVNNSFLRLQGTVTNTGTMNLNSLGNFTELRIVGLATLAGNGTTTLGNNFNNRIVADAAGAQLTVGAGQTIQGSGQIGAGGVLALVNQGTITANQITALTVAMTGGMQNAAGGLMQATTGTLNLSNPLVNNGTLAANGGIVNATAGFSGSGTVLISGAGQMNVGAPSSTGTLTHNGSAAAGLALGANSLTVNSDYTNANTGSGNSFNRRANVTGTGAILAGGDVAQLISGTGVSGGNTTNATLTIGNMRVGTNTYNVNIGNIGTTGPTLRGAIQTNVNGGDISDGRLGGSGVTAGNYNAGGPGGLGSDQVITFTAASAGALGALSGQAINLRSNFDNIADQRLNIVLAGGAAAYNAAVGSTVTPVQVANQRVSGSNSATLAISNTAAAGSFSEDLNASIGSVSGQASATGIVNGRLAGTNNTGTGAITVGVNTAAAGAQTGGVTLNYQTAGAVGGVSNGLGTAAAGSQVVTVNGNVFQVAQTSPGSLPAVVNLGNFRAGAGAQTQTINITNTDAGAPVGFQEGLAAAIIGTTGAATGSGFANATVGSSGALVVGLSGIAAGINTGSAQVQLRSNGTTTTGSNGLGDLDLGSAQTVTVNGTGWRLAQANAIAPVAFGNVLAGSTQERFLTISNTASNDGFSEALNAAFGMNGGTNPGLFSTSGSINGLLAGAPADSTSMRVTLNTSNTGAVSANVQILLNSNGAGVSNGLGLTALATQTINLDGLITAVVGNLASAGMSPTSVNFGKFREGAASQTQQLTITNLTTSPGEGLNASFGTATGVTNNGASIASLAPTASSTAMSVTLGGLATAGAKSGTQVVNFASDGTFNNGTTTALPSQTVTLNAEVYRLAQGNVTPTVNLAARRVGDAGSTGTITIANSAANDGFSEGLVGTLSAAPGGFIVAGPATTGLISAGSNTARNVTLDTSTAGSFSGNVNVALVSNGAGTSGFGDLALPGQSTAVTGNVYTAAIGQTPTTALDFGIVRVGDTVSAQNIVINNTAAVTALNDTLSASLTGNAGPFSGGSLVGVVAGGSDNLGVSLNTASAGVFSQTAQVGFTSQNDDMSDVSAGANASVSIMAQVNNLANGDFDLLSGSGTLSQIGTSFELNLGTLMLGSTVSSVLQLDNETTGPSDELSGIFNLAEADDFEYFGWEAITSLAAGMASGALNVNWTAVALGMFTDTLIFSGLGTNASDSLGLAQTRTLTIRANVIAAGGPPGTVPEPGTLPLLLAAAAAGWAVRRRAAGNKARAAAEGAAR